MQVPPPFVTDQNVIWKSVTKTSVTIGQQKVGQTGQHGETVQNHVVVALESDDGYARIVIIIVMIPGTRFMKIRTLTSLSDSWLNNDPCI